MNTGRTYDKGGALPGAALMVVTAIAERRVSLRAYHCAGLAAFGALEAGAWAGCAVPSGDFVT
ncbi:hypothetical protein GCM10028812_50120 [Ancylobacter sonchi]